MAPKAVTRPHELDPPERLSSTLYAELHDLAEREMARERVNHTLQPTALANEAWLRLAASREASFENRAHFFGAAAIAIRRVLVDHARRRASAKRGGGARRVGLSDLDFTEHSSNSPVPNWALLQLDKALVELASFAPDSARIVELRYFAGRSLPEIAELTGVSVSTVQREWRLTRAWLKRRLEGHYES